MGPRSTAVLTLEIALLVLGLPQVLPSDNGPRPATVVSLAGNDWKVAADPDNVGRTNTWWKGPVPGAKPVRVPGILQEALPAYHGVAWYWREFVAPPKPSLNGRCLLRFHAVDYLADVWVNAVGVGQHEGGETPFTFDITDAVRPEALNQVVVRVLNPRAEPIDGIVLAETPHRNKVPAGIGVGGSYNSGGITEPVEVFWAPAVRIEDVFVRPDWKTGDVRMDIGVFNAGPLPVSVRLDCAVSPEPGHASVGGVGLTAEAVAGASRIACRLRVAQHRLWQLDDPCRYRLTARLSAGKSAETDESVIRFGFRELRVEQGFFRLNGRRIFLKSAHTGNHCPVGAIVPPDAARDLLRKDLLSMKACGFNAVRFIAGLAHPYQLDVCDEIGLMVYEENLAAWLLADSPKMAERFDASLREMVLRDRNHPSVVIFGLVNEMPDGPMARHAAASLGRLRALDDTRLVLHQSGRWDGRYQLGSVSNPGGTEWEHVWGVEAPDYPGTARGGPWGGYFEGAGDAHVYPATPHTPAIEAGLRNLGRGTKPVFLSEYGVGSLMNAVRELRFYEQSGANPEWDDFKYFQQTEEKLTADWLRLGMDGVYAFPEEMLRASQQLHVRQRELGFSLIRSNPQICGYNLTGLLDHGYTGEGLWTFWREFKPGIMDVLQEGWAPLRWCLFASPMHGYTGRPVQLEVVLANEDVLGPGTYPVWLRVIGPEGVAWEQRLDLVIPQPADPAENPLAIPVFAGQITIPGPAGQYTFAATLFKGGAPAAGRLRFQLTDPPHRTTPVTVHEVGVDSRVQAWLKSRQVQLEPLTTNSTQGPMAILIGNAESAATDPVLWSHVRRLLDEGSTAVVCDPGWFWKDGTPLVWLPLKNKGRLIHFSDWLYHKECVAGRHPLFAQLPPAGIMDWDYYGPLISNRFLEDADTPAEVAAAAFAICHSSRPDGYAAGVMLGAYRVGRGRVVLNTFNLLENVDRHPAADRLLLNLIESMTTAPTSAQRLQPARYSVRTH